MVLQGHIRLWKQVHKAVILYFKKKRSWKFLSGRVTWFSVFLKDLFSYCVENKPEEEKEETALF